MYIHLYKDNPTAGGTDGILVSEGTESDPIMIPALDTTANEVSSGIKLAIRTESTHQTFDTTTITPFGTNALSWALSLNNIDWLAYGAALEITNVVTAVNTVFYARAKSTDGEPIIKDTSVDLRINCKVVAV